MSLGLNIKQQFYSIFERGYCSMLSDVDEWMKELRIRVCFVLNLVKTYLLGGYSGLTSRVSKPLFMERRVVLNYILCYLSNDKVRQIWCLQEEIFYHLSE